MSLGRDESYLASGSKDRSIRIWDISAHLQVDPGEAQQEIYIKKYEETIKAIQKEKNFWKQECFRWQEKYKKLEEDYIQLKNTIEMIPPIIKPENFSFSIIRLPDFSSSLFHSACYALEPSFRDIIMDNEALSKNIGLSIRKLISSELLRSSLENKADLINYIEKIEDLSFKGSVEDLEVLSKIHKTEFCILDVQKSNPKPMFIPMNEKYNRRVYLYYYPKYEKYDIVTARVQEKNQKETEFTIFNSKDEVIHYQILNLWEKLQSLNQSQSS